MLNKLYKELEFVYAPENIHKLYQSKIKFNVWNSKKIDDFNKLMRWLKNNATEFEWSTGHFISGRRGFRFPAYCVKEGNFWVDLVIVSNQLQIARIQMRFSEATEEDEETLTGSQAFIQFRGWGKSWGIDLKKYEIDNGEEVKKTIPKYLIWMEPRIRDFIFTNAHHIDFHSSFPAGLANTHPEFRPFLEWLYEGRKEDPIKKAILNYSIGFMQSLSGCQARWAHLAKDAIEDNNKRVNELVARLKKAGRTVVGLNTDGIWYVGKIYHGEGEGSGLGQWENDHINCKLRYKTRGCYEFIEDGVYHPVVRGKTSYESVVPRDQWVWGDIYKHVKYISYAWDGNQIIKIETEENQNEW